MNMTDAGSEFLSCCYSIFSCKSKVTRIVTEPYITRSCFFHQTPRFCQSLHDRSHMMMVTELKSAFRCNMTEAIQSIDQSIPFFCIGFWLRRAKHGCLFCEKTMRQLTDINPFRT